MASIDFSLLDDPHPCRHIVYPYDDEEKAINAVYIFLCSGLSKGESVILIMADSQCEPIARRLTKGGFNFTALQASARLVSISADRMVRKFMPNGKLNETLFKDTIRQLVGRARANSPTFKVRIFGEMVSLLLARGEIAAAEQLEMLWNEAIETHSVSLFCTYGLLEKWI